MSAFNTHYPLASDENMQSRLRNKIMQKWQLQALFGLLHLLTSEPLTITDCFNRFENQIHSIQGQSA